MKKIILAVLVSMMMVSQVYADEEIQLAAVMTESSTSPIETNKKIYATSGFQGGGGSAGLMSGSTILVGIVVAGSLVMVADGFSSTSNH